MPDSIIRSEQQPTFEELRNEYRAENLKRIRAGLRKDRLVRYRKDGTVAGELETGLMTTAPEGQEWRSVKDFLRGGGKVPEFSEDFRIEAGRGLEKELRDLERDTELLEKSDAVERPVSSVECGFLPDLSDDSVLTYMDSHVRKESDGSSEATTNTGPSSKWGHSYSPTPSPEALAPRGDNKAD